MLPTFYQNYLENQLEPSELLVFNILINVLQNIKEVSLEKIATALQYLFYLRVGVKKSKDFYHYLASTLKRFGFQ